MTHVMGWLFTGVFFQIAVLENNMPNTPLPFDTMGDCPFPDGLNITKETLHESAETLCHETMQRALWDILCRRNCNPSYACENSNFPTKYKVYTKVKHVSNNLTALCEIAANKQFIVKINCKIGKPIKIEDAVYCQETDIVQTGKCTSNSTTKPSCIPDYDSPPTTATSTTTPTTSSSPSPSPTPTQAVTPSTTKPTEKTSGTTITAGFTSPSKIPAKDRGEFGTQSSSSATIVGAVVGGIIGGVVLTVVAVVVWWQCRRRRRSPLIQTENDKRDSHIYLGLFQGPDAGSSAAVPDVIKESGSASTPSMDKSTNEYEVIPDRPKNGPVHCTTKINPGTSNSNSDLTQSQLSSKPEQSRPDSVSPGDYIDIIDEELDGTGVYSLGKACPKTVSPAVKNTQEKDYLVLEPLGKHDIGDTYNETGDHSKASHQIVDYFVLEKDSEDKDSIPQASNSF